MAILGQTEGRMERDGRAVRFDDSSGSAEAQQKFQGAISTEAQVLHVHTYPTDQPN